MAPGAEYFTERSKNKTGIPRKNAQMDSGVQTEMAIFNSHTQTDPVSGLLPLPCIASPFFNANLGRESRQVPEGDVGTFKAPVSYTPTLGSFAAKGGLAHVPVLSRNKTLVPSKTLKRPVLSKVSKVIVFRVTHKCLDFLHTSKKFTGRI